MLRLGVDVGGTFTDLVLYDPEQQSITMEKIPSSLDNQAAAVMGGIARMGVSVNELDRLVHGTTVATNTVLEFTGARVAVVTTAGHRDVLIVGRGNRMDMYNIKAPPLRSLIERTACYEVSERLRADGTVLQPLDEQQVQRLANELASKNIEAVIVCFLHSYANPEHERRCVEIIKNTLPDAVVVASADVLPEYREYERFSTALLNAYIAPAMQKYLRTLSHNLANEGLQTTLEIMTSNGGALPVARIHELPVLTMLSGPAAGVIAACHLGGVTGHPNMITCDIGGTSSDICLIHDLAFSMTTEGKVGMLPVKVRQIDIHTVAIGGGSIASNGAGDFLTVGPRSAGSMPGPACYGRGGTQPTITDANLVLGRLDATRTLGKEITLDLEAARQAIAPLAKDVGLGIEAMAEGIIRLATISLASAIKEVSIMNGQDPRDFALLPCGGAGPLQAVDVAVELGMKTVIVPPLPGNFSALGLLVSDARRDYVRTRIVALDDTDVQAIRATFSELMTEAEQEFDLAHLPKEGRVFSASLDVRYVGQSFELPVSVSIDVESTAEVARAFEEVYVARYGAKADAAIEIVNYRLVAWSYSDKPKLPEISGANRSEASALIGHRSVIFNGIAMETAVYDRDGLPGGFSFDGPAIVEESGSTISVPPGWRAELDRVGCLVLRQHQG